ncbi:hypothetical protein INS49_001252 [Diaporthe citri]|uniref:uncharacterized protein n=1 Tax=Diaporthe citri TaxID=83186 RepID=UPI001C7FBC40|nr:uncharacterized protein INS49_001252 [Diaporthe citri]KAG6367070.1 hypothetical protein INS49_001252 [Diaporthe citri]
MYDKDYDGGTANGYALSATALDIEKALKRDLKPGELLWKGCKPLGNRLRKLARALDTFIPIEVLGEKDNKGILRVPDEHQGNRHKKQTDRNMEELTAAIFIELRWCSGNKQCSSERIGYEKDGALQQILPKERKGGINSPWLPALRPRLSFIEVLRKVRVWGHTCSRQIRGVSIGCVIERVVSEEESVVDGEEEEDVNNDKI